MLQGFDAGVSRAVIDLQTNQLALVGLRLLVADTPHQSTAGLSPCLVFSAVRQPQNVKYMDQ